MPNKTEKMATSSASYFSSVLFHFFFMPSCSFLWGGKSVLKYLMYFSVCCLRAATKEQTGKWKPCNDCSAAEGGEITFVIWNCCGHESLYFKYVWLNGLLEHESLKLPSFMPEKWIIWWHTSVNKSVVWRKHGERFRKQW